ncbi:MAG: hypothetical protein GX776_00250 [Oxalobacter sp.]|nr:hypothetical protein [Oxalobacter sp.]
MKLPPFPSLHRFAALVFKGAGPNVSQPISQRYRSCFLIKNFNDAINKKNFTLEKGRAKLWIGSMFACVIDINNGIFGHIVSGFSLVTKATFISMNGDVCCA